LTRLKGALLGLFALFIGAGTLARQRPEAAPASATPASSPTPAPASASISAPAILKPGPNHTFPLGQTLVYGGVWRIFDAGTATLHMEPAGTEMRVVGTANATSAVALLFHVHDHYESLFDQATFCSHTTSRRIEEGFRRGETNITFDYPRGKSVLEQKNLKKNETKRAEHNIPNCVTDVLSGIFYAASLPLQPGQIYSFPLNDGGETLYVNVHAEAREQIKTPAGTFNTIRVQPETSSGLLKEKGKIWIWYSDDALRIPVQARVRLYWGMLTFTLQRIDKK
jgi:Protein of unknown function (DUF3108)